MNAIVVPPVSGAAHVTRVRETLTASIEQAGGLVAAQRLYLEAVNAMPSNYQLRRWANLGSVPRDWVLATSVALKVPVTLMLELPDAGCKIDLPAVRWS